MFTRKRVHTSETKHDRNISNRFRKCTFSGNILRFLHSTKNNLAPLHRRDIQQEFQDEYGRSFSVFPEFAFFGEQKRLLYGIHLINPLQLRTKSTKHETISKLQAGYKITKELSCITQLQQTSINKFTFSFGLQYNLQGKITINVQYDNQEQPINLMIMLPYKRFRCFVETAFNYYLGITNCVAFSVVL